MVSPNLVRIANPVTTDSTMWVFTQAISPSTCDLDPRKWRRTEKVLQLHQSKQSIYLFVAIGNEKELLLDDLVVVIRAGK